MKLKVTLFTLLALTAFVVSGCGLAGNLLGGSKGGTVSNLWSDVPAPPNATKANIDIPPLANLIIQGFVQAANSQNSDSETKLDKFDFIGYQTTDTPQAVTDYYSVDKMKAAGWNAEDMPGCQSGGNQGMGAFCAFGRKDASNKQTVLLIMPVQDDGTKQTQIFFVRFEGTNVAK